MNKKIRCWSCHALRKYIQDLRSEHNTAMAEKARLVKENEELKTKFRNYQGIIKAIEDNDRARGGGE